MLLSSCISPILDDKKSVPRASCVQCGIEYPLHLTQKACWSTSSTMVDDAPFPFDHLQDLSSICSEFRMPAMPVFDPPEAITSQRHPSRLSNQDFQYAASSWATPDLVLLGCFGGLAPSLPDEVSSMQTGGGEGPEVMSLDQHVLKKKGFINKKKKHVYRKPKVKGRWTAEEDGLLPRLVQEHGSGKWAQIAQFFKGRVGKQCRERWYNHLKPDVKKGMWTEEEDIVLIQAHSEIGNKWVEISKRLPGRTENAIKNHWNNTMRQLLRRCASSNPPVAGSSSAPVQKYMNSILGRLANTNYTIIDAAGNMHHPDSRCMNAGSGHFVEKPWMERLDDGYYRSKDMSFFDALAMLH